MKRQQTTPERLKSAVDTALTITAIGKDLAIGVAQDALEQRSSRRVRIGHEACQDLVSTAAVSGNASGLPSSLEKTTTSGTLLRLTLPPVEVDGSTVYTMYDEVLSDDECSERFSVTIPVDDRNPVTATVTLIDPEYGPMKSSHPVTGLKLHRTAGMFNQVAVSGIAPVTPIR